MTYRDFIKTFFYSLAMLFSSIGYGQLLQDNDSIVIELTKIREKNDVLRVKDSIRAAILKEELSNIINPKSKELEKYKIELQKLKQEDSLRDENQKKSINALRNKVKPFPVKFFYKTLYSIYGELGPFSAQYRAMTVQENLKEIYNQKVYYKDSFKIEEKKYFNNILYRGKVIASVGEEDALWENTSRDSLSLKYVDKISLAIEAERENHAFENKAYRWLSTLGIILVFFVLVWLLSKLFKFITLKIIDEKKIHNKGLRINNYQLFTPQKLRRVIIRGLNGVKLLFVFVFLYIALSWVFSIFPATEHWAYRLLDIVWRPLKELGKSLYNYLPRLIKIFFIILLSWYANKLLRFFSVEIIRENLKIRRFHPEWAVPTYKLLRMLLIAFTIIICFPYLPGSETAAFKGISIFFGLLISIGSSTAIANTIAGFIITYMRPYKEGDWIKIDNIKGEVIEKTSLVTRLRTLDSEDVTVPNSMILTNETINYSSSASEEGIDISLHIKIPHSVHWQVVNDLLIKAALATDDVVQQPAPYVSNKGVKKGYIKYELKVLTQKPERENFIISGIYTNIYKIFEEEKIDIFSRYLSNKKNRE